MKEEAPLGKAGRAVPDPTWRVAKGGEWDVVRTVK
jgi:hypothetical protein